MKKIKIGIIIGSRSDLSQCYSGLMLLKEAKENDKIDFFYVYIASQHRNTLTVQAILTELSRKPIDEKPDLLIIGAGWANHLSGCSDAFLRYTLYDEDINVIGVAFEDKKDKKHTKAAELSITEVPGTQVIFKDRKAKFIGSIGFYQACYYAISGYLPEIKIKPPKKTEKLTLSEALTIAEKD